MTLPRGSWLRLSMEDPTPPLTPEVVGLKTRLFQKPSINREPLQGISASPSKHAASSLGLASHRSGRAIDRKPRSPARRSGRPWPESTGVRKRKRPWIVCFFFLFSFVFFLFGGGACFCFSFLKTCTKSRNPRCHLRGSTKWCVCVCAPVHLRAHPAGESRRCCWTCSCCSAWAFGRAFAMTAPGRGNPLRVLPLLQRPTT